MPAPSSFEEFLDLVRKSGVVDEKRLGPYVEKLRATGLTSDPARVAGLMVHDAILTHFQAEFILQGKWRRFTIGKYTVLERLGSGGMGHVYLCEHKLMRRRVAVKVLPTAMAEDPASLQRFYREARAVAALDHPNIVRAYDIDQDDKWHFLVMEYVDGSSLQEMVKKTGPMNVTRAAHYIQQAALGLQHAHQTAGLVHRDIKPGNILVNRKGVVKILDMGLARFFHDEDDVLTKKYDENVLGTADYLAPEQALDSHGVDIRADIYSLGATFYFCLTGRTLFSEGTVAQKLIWHQTRQPKPIRQIRPEVPETLTALIEKMMAKDPAQRPQLPREVAEALAPWTKNAIGPPPEEEMPRLSPAALGIPGGDSTMISSPPTAGPKTPPSFHRKNWQISSSSPPSPPPSPTPRTPGNRAPGPSSPGPGLPSARVGTSPPVSQGDGGKTVPSTASADFRPPGTAVQNPRQKTKKDSPAETGPQPALSAVVSPVKIPEEEPGDQAGWDAFGPETVHDQGQANTPLVKGQTATRPAGRMGAGLAGILDLLNKKRVWWVAGVMGLLLLSGLAALTLWVFHPGSTRLVSPEVSSSGRTLIVGADGKFHSILEALKQARPYDRIVVQGPSLSEELRFDGSDGWLKHITIESEDTTQPATWRPRSKDPSYLLVLKNVEGWRLQGFILDGQERCQSGVVLLAGRCPGTTLDRVRVQGFQNNGVLFSNCQGELGRPVTLTRSVVASLSGGSAESGIVFALDSQTISASSNRALLLQDCRLEGFFRKPIQVLPSARGKTNVYLKQVTYRRNPDKPAEPINKPFN